MQLKIVVVTSDTLSLSVPLPPGFSIFWFVGLVQVLFDASKSRHKLLSVSPARCLCAVSTLTHTWRDGAAGYNSRALVDVEGMAN